MKISCIQMNSGSKILDNLQAAQQLIESCVAQDSPDLVVLPENFDFRGGTEADKSSAADSVPGGRAYEMARMAAKANRIWIHAGSLHERISGQRRHYNTTVVFDREGRERARYRKIHLFDVTGPDGMEYRESADVAPGHSVSTYDLEGMTVGCAICYDLRFSELFLAIARAGASVIVIPAAFTLQTGKDHWEVLLRARAIETQTYVAASGQYGRLIDGKGQISHSFGHSMICDPWGHVIAKASDGVGHTTATIRPEAIQHVRKLIPMSEHRCDASAWALTGEGSCTR